MPDQIDRHVVSLLRRRELENAVHDWAAQLEKEVAYHQRRAERHRGTKARERSGEHWQQQATKAMSLWDLVRRGLDPKQERRFVGRVSLTVRCKAKGHVLALVYPTCALPVFVPSVRGMPPSVSPEAKARLERAASFARQHFPWALAASRDPWIETFEGDDGEVFYDIRGLAVLQERHRLYEMHDDQLGTLRTAFYLICRCGQQMVAPADVMRALDRGDRHLTAVFTP